MRPVERSIWLLCCTVLLAPVANADDLDDLFGEAQAESPSEPPAASAEKASQPAPVVRLEPDAPPRSPAPQARVIEEIVVTAQKTRQNIQEVPVSVSALNADTLRETGTFDAAALENFVPNVEIDIDPQAPLIGIRGFATEADNVGFEPAVGLALDELSLGRSEFIPDGMFDIERIEVLRGPQGTLFGKNTIAGVITFASADPGEFAEASLLATLGDPGEQRIEAAGSLPLTDAIAARLSGVFWDREGDVHNTTLNRSEADHQQRAGRLKLRAHLGTDWTLRLSHQLSDTTVDYAPWQLFDAPESVLAFNRNYDPAVEDQPLNAIASFDQPGFVDRDSDLSRLLVEHGGASLFGLQDLQTTLVLGTAGFDLHTIIDIDISPSDILITDFGNRFRQESLELRTAGATDSLWGWGQGSEFVLGVYAYQANLVSQFDNFAGADLAAYGASPAGVQTLGGPDASGAGALLGLLPTGPGAPVEDGLLRGFEQATRSYAVFGQMTWDMDARWSLITGLRLGVERKLGRFDVRSVGPGIIAQIVGAEPYQTTQRRSESDVSPKLGLLFAWTDNINSFVTWTRGFKGGGFNATSEVNENLSFEAERADSLEAGFKSTWLARSLRLNLSLYRTDVENLQVVDFVNTSFRVSNAGEARLQGLEAELTWLPPWPWFSVTAAAGVGDARYLTYRNAAATEAQGDNGQDTQDLSGRTLPNAPKLSAAISPTLSLPLPWGRDWGLRWTLDVSYRGDQYSATDLDPHSFQSGHWLLGSRLVLGPADGQWGVIFNGSNLTNRRALDLVFDHSVYDNTYIAQQIPLRRFGLSLQFKL